LELLFRHVNLIAKINFTPYAVQENVILKLFGATQAKEQENIKRINTIMQRASELQDKIENEVAQKPLENLSLRGGQIVYLKRSIHEVQQNPLKQCQEQLDILFQARAYQTILVGDYLEAAKDLQAIKTKTHSIRKIDVLVRNILDPEFLPALNNIAHGYLNETIDHETGKILLKSKSVILKQHELEDLWIVNRPLCERVLARIEQQLDSLYALTGSDRITQTIYEPLLSNLLKVVASELLASENVIVALDTLGYCYRREVAGFSKDLDKGIEYIKKAAELGSKHAMVVLGRIYYYSDHETKKLAFECFQKAYMLGYLPAVNDLAHCYLLGIGVPRDPNWGLEILKRVLFYDQIPDPTILHSLGQWYQNVSRPQDLHTAVVYYQKAAERGSSLAIEQLQTQTIVNFLKTNPVYALL
jgi:hypothetical protein